MIIEEDKPTISEESKKMGFEEHHSNPEETENDISNKCIYQILLTKFILTYNCTV